MSASSSVSSGGGGGGLVSYPTAADNRPYVPLQIMLPSGQWSETIEYNFDTGASWPTDIPPQLLPSFGGAVISSARKEQPGKVRVPGFNGSQEMSVPLMVQDKEHYDLFKSQPSRHPLCRVHDLMPYMSITFTSRRTYLRTKTGGGNNPPNV